MDDVASSGSGADGGAGQTPRPVRPPSLVDALIPLLSLAVLIGLATVLFAPDPTNGPLQVALLVSAMIAALVAMKNGHTWEEVAGAGTRALSSVMGAIFILLAVGALIGTWNLAGTIPTLVAYGIRYLQPEWFYPEHMYRVEFARQGMDPTNLSATTVAVGPAPPRSRRGARAAPHGCRPRSAGVSLPAVRMLQRHPPRARRSVRIHRLSRRQRPSFDE